MRELVDEFLEHLRQEGYSIHTVNAYESDLKQFIDFWTRKKAPEMPTWTEVDAEGIVDYILYLKERSYAPSSLARKIAALCSFFHYLVKSGVIKDDPTAAIELPKVPKRVPRYLTRSQVERLLEAPANSQDPKALRDKAILELLYHTGLKASELISLNLEDVDLASGTVRVVYGRGKERVVSLPGSALRALREYLDKGRRHFLPAEGEPPEALFLNFKGKRLTRQGLWVIIKRYAEMAGIKEKISPNILRHSLVVHKIREGTRLRDLEKLLGYSTPLSIIAYSKAVAEEDTDE